MYNLTKENIKSLEGFIKSIPESIVKSQVEALFVEPISKERVLTEQAEKFLSLVTHLPQNLQSFPQNWLLEIKTITSSSNEMEETKKEKEVKPKSTK